MSARARRVSRSPAVSGGLVDAEHVGVEGQRGQRLLLGPAHPPDADAEALRRRLERRRGVAVEAEAEPQHVALEARAAARPPRGPGRRPSSARRRRRSPTRRARPARPAWWTTRGPQAGRATRSPGPRPRATRARRRSCPSPRRARPRSGARPSVLASSDFVSSRRWICSPTSRGIRMVRPCCWTARWRAWRIHQVAYVEKRKPRSQSNLSTARIRPKVPSWTRSAMSTPRSW